METKEHTFIRLSSKQLRELDMDALVAYRKRERACLLGREEPGNIHKIRKIAHPLLMGALRIYHRAKGIRIRTNGAVPSTDRPVIFSVTHIGLYDVEVVLQAVKKHAYLLSGDEEVMYRTFDGWFFDANGVIYVDPGDSADRKIALKTAVKFLKQGRSVIWFPEGTWNLSSNYVILPIHYGIIDAAVQADAVIIPVGLEQYDRRHGIDFVVNIGTAFDPARYVGGELTSEKKTELAERLRGDMARLKMDAWESASRADIDSDYWDRFAAKRFAEWPYYTMDIIHQREFNPKGIISRADAFSYLKHITVGPHNAFLARMQNDYLRYLSESPGK